MKSERKTKGWQHKKKTKEIADNEFEDLLAAICTQPYHKSVEFLHPFGQ